MDMQDIVVINFEQCRPLREGEALHTDDLYLSTSGSWQRAGSMAGIKPTAQACKIWWRPVRLDGAPLSQSGS